MTAADKPSPIPDTYRRVTPSLVVQGAAKAAAASTCCGERAATGRSSRSWRGRPNRNPTTGSG